MSKTDAGTLVIDVPARGFGADTLFSAAFAVAWFSGVGAWTAAAVTTGPLAALFSLPFWLAGARARAREGPTRVASNGEDATTGRVR